MKTRLDVLTLALRRVGAVAHDETLTADQIDIAGSVYDATLAEISADLGEYMDGNAVPDKAFAPLANLMSADLAAYFGLAAPQSRGSAYLRLVAVLRPDDRTHISEPEYF